MLSYADMWDMPLGGVSDEKEIPHWAGNLIYGVLFAICKLLFRYRVDGIENLRGFKGKSGVVVVANHTSFLDTVFLYLSSRPDQWVRLMGRDTLFDNAGGLVGQVLSRVGAFPVKRDSADMKAIKRAARMLKRKEAVGMFPEGTRRGKGTARPELHPGAAFIARTGKAPMLPMTVRNAEKIKQKGKFFRFPKVSVEYGNPVLVSDFDFLPKEDRLEGCIWFVMRECYALSYRCCVEEVDMKQLYPDAKDFSEVFEKHQVGTHTTSELVAGIDAGGKRAEEEVSS